VLERFAKRPLATDWQRPNRETGFALCLLHTKARTCNGDSDRTREQQLDTLLNEKRKNRSQQLNVSGLLPRKANWTPFRIELVDRATQAPKTALSGEGGIGLALERKLVEV